MSFNDTQRFQHAMFSEIEEAAIAEFTNYLKLIVNDPEVKFNKDKIKMFVRMDLNNYSIIREHQYNEGYRVGYADGFMHCKELKKKDEN